MKVNNPKRTKLNGFKLKSLEVINHNILGTNTFNFTDEDDTSDSIYFTVLIGPNGTGKSELFRFLLEIFRGIFWMQETKFYLNCYFSLQFWNSGSLFELSNKKGSDFRSITKPNAKYPSPITYINDKEIEVKEFIKELPSNIIANSLMLTDKFIAPRNGKEKEDFPIYKYLGVRNRPQQASTRGYVRKTVEFIVEQINSDVFKEGLNNLSKFLGYDGSVLVQYKTAYTNKFFKGDLTKDKLDVFFNEIENKYKNIDQVPPFKLNYYKSLSKKSGYIEDIVSFVNNLFHKKRFTPIYRSSANYIKYFIDDDVDHRLLKEEYPYIDDLRKLGFVSAPMINLIKGNQALGVQQTSSGEFHFFSTMVGLMATVKPNSLILIDEPEISLHPNWQMRYLEFIRQLFSSEKYGSCQIIIATHSHFLISDLKGDSAKIIGLTKDDDQIKTIDINSNTFGWSAEEVLYKVFDVRTTRNHYLEMDLRKMLSLVAEKSRDKSEISKILDRVKDVQLDENDPLRLIVDQVEKYLEK